ncbi:MAG: hypothetical protein M4579_002922 [Chaenotheca gracillima]|nr:MAG: hypothetical protein M4579_002922 [Chaenotheca gracillima]
MATHASAGAAAMASRDYEMAITCYDAAISEIPNSPAYYTQRSAAHQRCTTPNLELALQDAETAVSLAHKRGKRELIASAQMRRGMTLYGQGKFGDAQQCFKWAQAKNEKESGLDMWLNMAGTKLEKLEEGGEGTSVSVMEVPDVIPSALPAGKPVADRKTNQNAQTPSESVKKVEGVQTPASKIRHEWYQTAENVVLTLLVKGAPKDKTTVEIQDRSITITFPMPNSSTFDLSLEPLFAPVNTSASKFSIMSTKIEVILKKLNSGQKWPALEGTPEPTLDTASSEGNPTITASAAPLPLNSKPTNQNSAGPSYPTSSRSGPKNWDKVADDLTRKPKKENQKGEKKGEEETEEQDGDEFEDDEEGDPVNGFFKKLYASADPDTRRAMIKSYQESNGTALSTNWGDVGKGKVETTPPDGMEAKKWEA